MDVSVHYENYCVWRGRDTGGEVWQISGQGNGTWQLTVYDKHMRINWVGSKTGTVGTSNGDTPEGTYTYADGCDNTVSTRTVSAQCVKCPIDASSCYDIFSILLSNTTGGVFDGLWVLKQYGTQPFWSTNVAGSRPNTFSSNDPTEMMLWCDGNEWVLQINFDPLCNPRWTAPFDGTSCPPITGWLLDNIGAVEESSNAGLFLPHSTSSQSTSSSNHSSHSRSSNSSSSSGAFIVYECARHAVLTVSGSNV